MSPVAPRYRKILRDLASHWFRTFLVVVSIAIGIIAVGVMLGGREILAARVRRGPQLVGAGERHLPDVRLRR